MRQLIERNGDLEDAVSEADSDSCTALPRISALSVVENSVSMEDRVQFLMGRSWPLESQYRTYMSI